VSTSVAEQHHFGAAPDPSPAKKKNDAVPCGSGPDFATLVSTFTNSSLSPSLAGMLTNIKVRRWADD
jgi:hypothetical protein